VTAPALAKWCVVMVWCAGLPRPHDEFCICICPVRHWYLFINSRPPYTRKARAAAVRINEFEVRAHEAAVRINNFELHFLDHESFVDTTVLQRIPAEDILKAWADDSRRKGSIPPSLRRRIKDAAQPHGVLPPEELSAILND
jgi:hypothetical protein